MINFKTITINTTKKPDEIISLLSWKTYQVNNLLFAKTNSISANNNRPLIGKIYKENNQFKIARLRPFFQTFIPQVFLKGQIKETGGESTIILKFQPSLLTTIFLLFLAYGTFQIILLMLKANENHEIFWNGLLWILVFPVLAILLVFGESNKMTKVFFQVLEFKK